jgi:hypothetical protein
VTQGTTQSLQTIPFVLPRQLHQVWQHRIEQTSYVGAAIGLVHRKPRPALRKCVVSRKQCGTVECRGGVARQTSSYFWSYFAPENHFDVSPNDAIGRFRHRSAIRFRNLTGVLAQSD